MILGVKIGHIAYCAPGTRIIPAMPSTIDGNGRSGWRRRTCSRNKGWGVGGFAGRCSISDTRLIKGKHCHHEDNKHDDGKNTIILAHKFDLSMLKRLVFTLK